MMRALFALCFVALASGLHCGVAYNGDAAKTLTDATTWSFNCQAAASNSVLFYAYNNGNINNGDDITGLTYAGQSMTKYLFTQDINCGGYISVWYLLNPPSGANNFIATGGDFCANNHAIVQLALSFNGWNGSFGANSGVTNSSTNPLSIPTHNTGSDVLVCFAYGVYAAGPGALTLTHATETINGQLSATGSCLPDQIIANVFQNTDNTNPSVTWAGTSCGMAAIYIDLPSFLSPGGVSVYPYYWNNF